MNVVSGRLMVRTDDDGNAIGICKWTDEPNGPNGGYVGLSVARIPYGTNLISQAELNSYAKRFVESVNGRSATREMMEEDTPQTVCYLVSDPANPDGLPMVYMADFLRYGPNNVPIFKTRDPVVRAYPADPAAQKDGQPQGEVPTK